MSDDITQRLADISQLMMEGQPFNDGDFTDIDEAISEIERLRADLMSYKYQNAELVRNLAMAQDERDEARRSFCKCHARAEAVGYAEGRGWDCFDRDQSANDPPPDSPLDRLARLDEEVGF